MLNTNLVRFTRSAAKKVALASGLVLVGAISAFAEPMPIQVNMGGQAPTSTVGSMEQRTQSVQYGENAAGVQKTDQIQTKAGVISNTGYASPDGSVIVTPAPFTAVSQEWETNTVTGVQGEAVPPINNGGSEPMTPPAGPTITPLF